MSPSNYIADIAARIRAAVPPEELPTDASGSLFLIYAVLALAKGEDVDRRDVHDAWAAWMTGIDPAHESIQPYDDLAPDVKREDDPYVAAIKEVAAQLGRPLGSS